MQIVNITLSKNIMKKRNVTGHVTPANGDRKGLNAHKNCMLIKKIFMINQLLLNVQEYLLEWFTKRTAYSARYIGVLAGDCTVISDSQNTKLFLHLHMFNFV